MCLSDWFTLFFAQQNIKEHLEKARKDTKKAPSSRNSHPYVASLRELCSNCQWVKWKQYKEPQTNTKHSGIGTEVRGGEVRGYAIGWPASWASLTTPMNFLQWSFETLDLFKFNSGVATKVGQWSPCFCQKTCALLDPMDEGGAGTQEQRNVKGVLSC